MKNFQNIIKEICDEQNIKYELLSKDWIMKLTKEEKTEYIVGMRFLVNNYTSAMICKDKYATYHVLSKNGLPITEHKLMYSNRIKSYSSDLNGKKEIKEYLKKHGELVIKDNCGTCGIDVYRASNYSKVKKYLKQILKRKDMAVLCPFLEIETEYRVVYYKGNVDLVFAKSRNNGEWKYNLCKGATAQIVADVKLRKQLCELALKVADTIGINFASIDLVKVDGKLMVLEVNSCICLEKFMEQVEGGRKIAKVIYSKAIEDIFQ